MPQSGLAYLHEGCHPPKVVFSIKFNIWFDIWINIWINIEFNIGFNIGFHLGSILGSNLHHFNPEIAELNITCYSLLQLVVASG